MQDRPGSGPGFIDIVFSAGPRAPARAAQRQDVKASPTPVPPPEAARLAPSPPPSTSRTISFSRSTPVAPVARPDPSPSFVPVTARTLPDSAPTAPLAAPWHNPPSETPPAQSLPPPSSPAAQMAVSDSPPDKGPVGPAAPVRDYSGWLDGQSGGFCRGWVLDKSDPGRRVEVEGVWGGEVIERVVAEEFQPRLLKAYLGDGRHGFRIAIPPHLGQSPERDRALVIRTAPDHVTIGTVKIPRQMKLGEMVEEAREFERKGDLEGALAYIEAALEIDGTLVKALWLGARVAYNLKDHEKARVLAERAAYLDPSNPRPAVILARIADNEQRTEDALRLWMTVPEADSAYREAQMKAARHLLTLGRHLEALRAAKTALRLGGGDKQTLRTMAESYAALGASGLALSTWRAFLEVAPDDKTGLSRIKALEGAMASGTGPAADDPDILLNSSLRDWRRGSNGAVTAAEELTTHVILTPLTVGVPVLYQICRPQEVRFDRLPHYGLRLHTEGEGFELSFRMAPDAPAVVGEGLRLSFEASGQSGSPALPLSVKLTGTEVDGLPYVRQVWSGHASARDRLLPFDLILSPGECAMCAAGALSLTIAAGAPGTVVIHAPRRVHALAPAKRVAQEGEDEVALRNLKALIGKGGNAALTASEPWLIPPTRVGYPFIDILVWSANDAEVGPSVAKALLECPAPFQAHLLESVPRPSANAPESVHRLEEDPRVIRVPAWSPHSAAGEWVLLLRGDARIDEPDWLTGLLDFALTSNTPLAQYEAGPPSCVLGQREELERLWGDDAVPARAPAVLAQIQSLMRNGPNAPSADLTPA